MSFKKIIGKIHLYLGFTSGIVVFIIGLTGCIYVFSMEIFHFVHRDLLYVPQQSGQTLPMSVLWEKAQAAIGENIPLQRGVAYQRPHRSWIFGSFKSNPNAITYFGTIDQWFDVHVNPYTGEVLGILDREMEFFGIVKMLHWSLLLKTDYGQPIVGWSTFIFVLMLLSGLFLWWPRNKSARKKRFSIKWYANWRRVNFDLHQVLGFYMLTILLIVACTGMVWAFKWFEDAVYAVAAGTAERPKFERVASILAETDGAHPVDLAHTGAREAYPSAYALWVSAPKDSTSAVGVYVQEGDGVHYKNASMQFDQFSGALLAHKSHENKNMGEKVIAANYDIHIGAILGLPGKIIAFFASLIATSLPITGFMIWWGRKKAQKKRRFVPKVQNPKLPHSESSSVSQEVVENAH